MIERLTDMPSGTIGFRAAGEFECDDYDYALVPGLRRALEARGGLRTPYVIEYLDEIEPGAAATSPGRAVARSLLSYARGRLDVSIDVIRRATDPA